MPGKVVSLRLEEELLDRIDARAKKLGRSRTEFLTWAVENALDDAERGVPDVPRARVENLAENERGEIVKLDPQEPASFDAGWTPSDKPPVNYALERQRKLNAAKEGKR